MENKTDQSKEVWYSAQYWHTVNRNSLTTKRWFAKLDTGEVVECTCFGKKPNFPDVIFLGMGKLFDIKQLAWFRIYSNDDTYYGRWMGWSAQDAIDAMKSIKQPDTDELFYAIFEEYESDDYLR